MKLRGILRGGAAQKGILTLALVQALFLLSPSLPMGEWRCEDNRLCRTCAFSPGAPRETIAETDADCAANRPAFAPNDDCVDCCHLVLTDAPLRHGSAVARTAPPVFALAPAVFVPETPAFCAVFLTPPVPVAEPPPSSSPRSPAAPRAPPTLT